MTDIVERLRRTYAAPGAELRNPDGFEAADEIERLRVDLLKAEMQAEIAGLKNILRAVARGRREGIEAAAKAAENCLHPSAERTAHAAVDDAVSAIRALLEDKQ